MDKTLHELIQDLFGELEEDQDQVLDQDKEEEEKRTTMMDHSHSLQVYLLANLMAITVGMINGVVVVALRLDHLLHLLQHLIDNNSFSSTNNSISISRCIIEV